MRGINPPDVQERVDHAKLVRLCAAREILREHLNEGL